MDAAKLSKSVRRITALRKDGSGHTTAVALYERGSNKKKKGTRLFKPLERAARERADAHSRAASSYLTRHHESNEKKRDGWLRDFSYNVVKASRRGSKAIKINRLFSY